MRTPKVLPSDGSFVDAEVQVDERVGDGVDEHETNSIEMGLCIG